MNTVYLMTADTNAYDFLKETIEQKFNISEPEIKRNIHGKPYISDLPHIHFNISHSYDMQVVAIGDCEVGVDIEKLRNADLRVAKRFAQKEREYVMNADSDIRFFEVWTRKEAYLKYKGTGISGGLNSFDVFDIEEISDTFTVDGYIISVCSNKKFKTEVVK